MTFAELLSQPGVTEEVELRGQFGFLAFHGGPVERVTSLIARQAAARSGSTFYSIDQPESRPLHIPSTRFDPAESSTLDQVIDHVETVCTVHGYGRDMEKQWLLLGGQNRDLARTLAGNLRSRLDSRFKVIEDLDQIPRELRGVHPRNPVNLPTHQGVQLELPPALRWNTKARDWADAEGLELTVELQSVIEALIETATSWAS